MPCRHLSLPPSSTRLRVCVVAALFLGSLGAPRWLSVPSVAAQTLPPAQILARMLGTDALSFRQGETQLTVLIQDTGGESRERHLTVRSAREGGARRAAIQVTAPAEVAGQAYLLREGATAAEDECYVYLPALDDAPRRISGSQQNGSFMGTHLSYGDLMLRDLRGAAVTARADEKVGQFDAWVLDLTPKSPSPGAAHIVAWVRKADFMPLRLRFVDESGEVSRTFFVEQTAVTGGAPYVRRLTVRPAAGGSTTVVVDAIDPAKMPAPAQLTPQGLLH